MVDVCDEAMQFAEELASARDACLAAVENADSGFPDPEEHVANGTGGFRTHASKMPRVAFRLALVVGMRAKSAGTCGIMVTASHNHHEDNGIKIVGAGGGFFNADWELLAEMILNSIDLQWSMKNLSELALRGFPTQVNLFGL